MPELKEFEDGELLRAQSPVIPSDLNISKLRQQSQGCLLREL